MIIDLERDCLGLDLGFRIRARWDDRPRIRLADLLSTFESRQL